MSEAALDALLRRDRVTVWELVQQPPGEAHKHLHDAVVVGLGDQSPKAQWVARGTVHNGEGAGNARRVFVFEIK